MTELATDPTVTITDTNAGNPIDVNKISKDSGMDQVSAKAYLQKEIFPSLEMALNNVRSPPPYQCLILRV